MLVLGITFADIALLAADTTLPAAITAAMGPALVQGLPVSAVALLLLAGLLLLARSGRDGELVGPAILSALVAVLVSISSATAWVHLHVAARVLLPLGSSASIAIALYVIAWRRAHVDELTGLPGRRALDEALDGLSGAHAIAVVDVDRFKRFNDRHGHEAGDVVLRHVARQLARAPGASAFRQGGEEFVLLFAGARAEAAAGSLEELRAAIASMLVRLPDAGAVRVTVSIGLARRTRTHATSREVLRAADAALYRAKRAGRNRVDGGPRPPRRRLAA
jgi:diguanylate cyclase (GGDEF)-like protein